MALTVQSLVSAGCRREAAAAHLPHIVRAMAAEEINTPERARYFLAQALHESGCLQFMEEIWGPTPHQVGYEGRRDLGNTHQGDGFRFRGRGPFMLTGRANYASYAKKLGRPFVEHPELVAKPADGWRVAAQYWSDRGLNALADRGDERGITRKINGAATDGNPSHHLRRMAIFAKLPKDVTPTPIASLRVRSARSSRRSRPSAAAPVATAAGTGSTRRTSSARRRSRTSCGRSSTRCAGRSSATRAAGPPGAGVSASRSCWRSSRRDRDRGGCRSVRHPPRRRVTRGATLSSSGSRSARRRRPRAIRATASRRGRARRSRPDRCAGAARRA